MHGIERISLPGRGLLRLEGPDRVDFLNGLVSNDVRLASTARSLYAALLTPQGKFLADMFISAQQDALWLDAAADHAADLLRRLKLYRLRAKVEITAVAGWQAWALLGAGAGAALGLDAAAGSAGPSGAGFACIDPRLAAMGARVWQPEGSPPPPGEPADTGAYERLRLRLGLPDGARDIETDKGLLLEHHFEALHGVDFRKGCYVGQELTARTKYRGLVKKQLFRVECDAGDLPPPGTMVTCGDAEAGVMRTGSGRFGLALLRLEQVERAGRENLPLVASGLALHAALPDYAAETPPAA